MKLVSLLFLLLLSSCGSESSKNDPDKQKPVLTKTHYSLIPIIEDFKSQLISNNLNPNTNKLNVDFYDIKKINYNNLDKLDGSNSPLAVCLSYSTGEKEILIDESQWYDLEEERQIALIFHEMGHCILGRHHDTANYRGYYLSIMNPLLLRNDDFIRFKSAYLKELFTKDKSELINLIDSFFNP